VIIAQDIPPARSSELELSTSEHDGRRVIKHRRRGTYLRVGPHESFLLEQLDGQQTYETIATRFQQEFADDISLEEIGKFVALARGEGLLEKRSAGRSKSRPRQAGIGPTLRRMFRAAREQSLLYFRVKLVNPDRLLSWLEPRTRFIFSAQLAILAVMGGLTALVVTWVHRGELLETVSTQFGLRAIALYWLTTIFVTVLHEFGHGLACKKYGGEVREMGALWIFFTPCLYCNVSDAWMFAGRWRRLLVSLAGTYVDLLVWMVSVALWRLAAPDSFLHSLAWVLVTGCGVRLAFNLNPLLRLDGYYALADLLQQPNLRLRARERMMGQVRWLFWGGPRPQPVKDHWILLGYGVLSWVFSVGLLGLLSFQLSAWLGQWMGVAGVLAAGGFFVWVTRSLNRGLLGGDFWTMLTKRWLRLVLFAGLLGGTMFVQVPDQAGGDFVIKPHVRWEVCAPVPGFLRAVHTAEGQTVEANSLVATIEIPELANQISRKQAEIAEVNAELRRLTTGARAEEITEQRARIERSKAWCDLGRTSLEKAEAAFQQELETLDFRIEQARAELDYRTATRSQAEQLFARGGLAEQQLMAQKRLELEAGGRVPAKDTRRRGRHEFPDGTRPAGKRPGR
jgi:putative peptide zinc metalloprotease protein